MKKMYLDVVHIYIFVFFKSDKWLQSYDLKCINMHNLDGGVYIGKFFEFSNFFESFQTNMAQNHPQLQIFPKMWLRLCQNGQFGMFFYLFPQIVWFSSAIYMQSMIVGFVVVVVKLIKFIMIIAIPVAVGGQPCKVQFPLI